LGSPAFADLKTTGGSMGDFAQLNDDEAELLTGGGGKKKPGVKGGKDGSNNKVRAKKR
jgi:hypothetical protein